eukprot:6977612-Pyramimonas_sp.AAC.1
MAAMSPLNSILRVFCPSAFVAIASASSLSSPCTCLHQGRCRSRGTMCSLVQDVCNISMMFDTAGMKPQVSTWAAPLIHATTTAESPNISIGTAWFSGAPHCAG